MTLKSSGRTLRGTASAFAITIAGLASTNVWAAETAQPRALEAIVVTAQKRSESVQDTPLAISALSGDAIETRQIDGVEDLSFVVPSLNFGQSTGNARIAIRGIGFDNISLGAEGRVAYHVDGVYLSRPASTFGTFFDVERVEVLRGPQGTLYGRNATGGSINVVTRGAGDALNGYGRVTLGNFNRIATEGALGGEVAPGFAARFAFRTDDREGYGRNLATGRDIDDAETRSGRLRFELSPSANFQAVIVADYHTENDRNFGYHYLGEGSPTVRPIGLRLGGSAPIKTRNVNHDVDPINDREFWGLNATLDWTIGDFQFRSITGYRDSFFRNLSDLDSTQLLLAPADREEESQQFSQEFQLLGETDTLTYLFGLYYFTEDTKGFVAVPVNLRAFGGPNLLRQGFYAGGSVETEAFAAFSQISWEVAPTLTLTGGLRYSWEEKAVVDINQFDTVRPFNPSNPPQGRTQTGSKSWDAVTPRLALEYRPNADTLLFASASRGFKSGGYNLGGVQPAFDPELIWSYEAGAKLDLLDRRFRANLTAFSYDYTDLQVSITRGTTLSVENAAKARIQGLEVELNAIPVDGLEFDLAVSLLDGTYRNYRTVDPTRPTLGVRDLSGNRITQAPEYTVNFGAQYVTSVGAGDLTARGEAFFSDAVFFTPFEDRTSGEGERERFNAYLTYAADAGWSVSAFGRNLTDEVYASSAAVGSVLVGFPVVGALEAPRTYGVELGYRF